MIFLFNLECRECNSYNITPRKTNKSRHMSGSFEKRIYDCNNCNNCFSVSKYRPDSPFRANSELTYD